MKFYIVAGYCIFKEIERDSLEDVLAWINTRLLGKMEYTIFTGYPYTFENMVYQHLVD